MDGDRERQASVNARPDTRRRVPGPYVMDAALAGVMAALLVGGTLLPGAPSGPAQVGVAGYLLLLGGAAALALRRAAPVVALAVVAACMLGYGVLLQPETATSFPLLVTVFSAATAGRRAWAALVSAVYLGGVSLMEFSDLGARTPREVVDRVGLLVGWFVAANVAGVVSRQRQAYLRQAEQRAIEAERTREEVARRRAGEERLRIARELHDSLTHSISIIKVQAGVAVHLARKRGEEVPAALLAIQEASGDAMRELRATLEVLREPSSEMADTGRIAELVERARSAGVPATLTVTGSPRALPPDVGHAAYRIVQEALTNVARHAGAASTCVHVGYLPDTLVVRVEDDGPGVTGGDPEANAARVVRSTAEGGTPGTGHTDDEGTAPGPRRAGVGLTGMRERVTALGGTLRTGPGREGGFTVHAELPIPAEPSPGESPAAGAAPGKVSVVGPGRPQVARHHGEFATGEGAA